MDYQRILNIAKEKIEIEFPEIINDIKNCISAGSTGGEIAFIVGKYLKDMEKTNPTAYTLMRKEIEEYIIECKKEGLIIK